MYFNFVFDSKTTNRTEMKPKRKKDGDREYEEWELKKKNHMANYLARMHEYQNSESPKEISSA